MLSFIAKLVTLYQSGHSKPSIAQNLQNTFNYDQKYHELLNFSSDVSIKKKHLRFLANGV